MCENTYINIQTGEVLGLEHVESLKENAMLRVRPELWCEWDFERNSKLGFDIYEISYGLFKKVNWICLDCKSNYDSMIANRVKGKGCPFCVGKKVNHTNSLASLRPDLAEQWHPTKNDNLTPHDVTCKSDKKAWWICKDCKSEFDTRIAVRERGSDCPYCSGQKVNGTNSLSTLNPKLASEWNYKKNGELIPDNVTLKSGRKVWWLGRCGHEWVAPINDRTKEKGTNCPYCNQNNPKVLEGFNDLWTVNKKLALLLANPEDGYRYSEGSSKKVDWKCIDCGAIIKNKAISRIKERGLSCCKCSDGIKYPEKVMISLLTELNIEFNHDQSTEWSRLSNKRYDFFIPSLNIIVEMHGRQHYDRPFGGKRGKSVQKEQENDKFKYDLALNNGINRYFSIDCRLSDFTYIKNSIMNSDLIYFLDLSSVNWKVVFEKSLKSKVFEICEIYNKNNIEQKEISKITGLSDTTVRRYLKIGYKLGITDYTPKSRRNKENSVKWMQKEIVQLDLNNDFIASFYSISLAGKSLNKENYSSISACCKGKAKTAYGYRWMYLEDYEKQHNKIDE